MPVNIFASARTWGSHCMVFDKIDLKAYAELTGRHPVGAFVAIGRPGIFSHGVSARDGH